MRMRRKKHLDDKLAGVSDYLISPCCKQKDLRIAVLEKEYFDFYSIFGNSNPVHLEIGCGKGRFAVLCAEAHQENNFLALEKSANVIYEGCVLAKNKGLNNIRFVNMDARLLPKYFAPHSVEHIYLNFSCPYPKKTYAARRLTHPSFLSFYRDILICGGKIYQKTDNIDFF